MSVPGPGPRDGAGTRPWTVFRGYTVGSEAVLFLMLPAMLLACLGVLPRDLAAGADSPLLLTLLLAQSLASATAAVLVTLQWTDGPPSAPGRWSLPEVRVLAGTRWSLVAICVPVALGIAVVATRHPALGDEVLMVLVASAIAVQLLRLPLPVSIIGSLVLGAVAALLGVGPVAVSFGTGVLVGMIVTGRSSLWLAALVRELDEARGVQAHLAVAEERLRFARDLHDVAGRDLSAIVVKAELASRLAERADPRAAAQGQEVAQIARSTLAEMRALVRGYHGADLATELRGTVSLLRSAGIAVDVEGDPADVPAETAPVAAWVLREAGTNVLRHGRPLNVRIALAERSIVVVNDGAGPGPAPEHGSGLQGLAARLGPEGSLRTRQDEGRYLLEARLAPVPPLSPTAAGGPAVPAPSSLADAVTSVAPASASASEETP
ncbi:sensor histidine kinase [Brachybacterium sp. AOP25-B2-12]|uniref:sensor histidine kinase n=1 Tax=Brachybacterium sp. AOP25-B2-12 TaxID=3457710 RepID=UPI004034C49B